MSESEQREIEEEAKRLYKDDGTVGLYQEQKRIGYIAGATAWANRDETKLRAYYIEAKEKQVADLKAQLEAAQEDIEKLEIALKELNGISDERDGWNKISVDYAVALEKAEKIIAEKEAELSRVKEVAEKMAEALKVVKAEMLANGFYDPYAVPDNSIEEALTEFANLMNQRDE